MASQGRSRTGIYAAMATVAMVGALGVVGAAGADDSANADVYARDLKAGRYTVEIQALDATGNRSGLAKQRVKL